MRSLEEAQKMIGKINVSTAYSALMENSRLLDPKTQRIEWNTNLALLALCDELQELRRDQDLIANRLAVISRNTQPD